MVSFFPPRHNISSAEKVWVALALATSAELSGGKIIFDTVSIIEFPSSSKKLFSQSPPVIPDPNSSMASWVILTSPVNSGHP